jgi:hypothetical protein
MGLGRFLTVIAALLFTLAFSATGALAQEPGGLGVGLDRDERRLSPLARDIDRRLRDDARRIEHELSLEQSRVDARAASEIQRRQTRRDVQLSEQRLNTLKTQAPQADPIPLLERRLDRVTRPTGARLIAPELESGFSTSLGLSGSIAD